MSAAGTVTPSHRVPVPGEAKARLIWCGLVVGLLTLQVTMGFAAITLSSADASFAVVPGYHEQALHWDETKAAFRQSASLGWHDNLRASEHADVLGHRRLTIELKDGTGLPLDRATVAAVVFHHARANEVQNIDFVEVANGKYEAQLLMRQSGLWEVRVDASRRGDRFLTTRQLEVASESKGVR